MILTVEHYSISDRFVPFSVVTQPEISIKPSGRWISIPGEDDWPSWARRHGFPLDWRHTLELETRNICMIDTREKFDRFQQQYRRSLDEPYDRFAEMFTLIDWARVAKRYRGIVIAPMRWDRLDAMKCAWYRPWDCASGCIWDHRVLQHVRTEQTDGAEDQANSTRLSTR